MIRFNEQLDKLQKSDTDTLELIEAFTDYLFSIGVRTDKERAWAIFQTAFKLPYDLLAKRNNEITYQGQGVHLTHKKFGNQILTIKDLGRFEIKANKNGRVKVNFTPSKDVFNYLEEKVKVNV